jgi:hypothetical protein
MVHTIQSITLKNDYPTVRSSNREQDCITPGAKKEPVLPTIAFNRAINNFADLLFSEYSLPTELEWRLRSVSMSYNEDGEFQCYKAGVTGFDPNIGKLTLTIDPQSKQNITPQIMQALEDLQHHAELFVDGASAQGNLFDEAA